MADEINKKEIPKEDIVYRYFISFLHVNEGVIDRMIADLDDILSEPEDLDLLRSMIAEKIDQDPGNIMIIAFSYMGQRDHNLDIMEPDEAAAYVSKQMENNDNG